MCKPSLITHWMWRGIPILQIPFVLMLGSCASSTKLAEAPPVLIMPPDPLLRACDLPHLLSDRDIYSSTIVKIWGRDRISLFECAQRHAALVQYMEGLEKVTSYSPDIQNLTGNMSQ